MDNLFKRLNGSCPYCGNQIGIVEGMVFDYDIDYDGYPVYLNSESYRVAAYCNECNKCLFVTPNDKGGYTVYPDNPAIPPMLYNIYKDKDFQRSSVFGMKLLESKDNPFTNIMEDNDCPF